MLPGRCNGTIASMGQSLDLLRMLLRQSALLLEIDLDFLKQGFEPQFVGPRIVAGKEDSGLWETCIWILVAGIEAALPKSRNHFSEFLVAIVQRSEERRVGKECVRPHRHRWSQYN